MHTCQATPGISLFVSDTDFIFTVILAIKRLAQFQCHYLDVISRISIQLQHVL